MLIRGRKGPLGPAKAWLFRELQDGKALKQSLTPMRKEKITLKEGKKTGPGLAEHENPTKRVGFLEALKNSKWGGTTGIPQIGRPEEG